MKYKMIQTQSGNKGHIIETTNPSFWALEGYETIEEEGKPFKGTPGLDSPSAYDYEF